MCIKEPWACLLGSPKRGGGGRSVGGLMGECVEASVGERAEGGLGFAIGFDLLP